MRLDQTRQIRCRPVCYFFFPEPTFGCQPPIFWLGAAAIVLTFGFLGFLASRLPRCSPLAMSASLGLSTHSDTNVRSTVRRDQPRARLKTRVTCVPRRSSRVQAPRSALASRQTCCVPALTCRGRKARPTPSHAHLSPRSCVGELSSASPVVRSWRLQLWSCHTVATRTSVLPVKNYNGGDQQPEKQRHEHRRNEPLAHVELMGTGHVTALSA